MILIEIIIKIIAFILFFYCCFPLISILVSLLRKRVEVPLANNQLSFACIITAYKEFDIALPQVDSILKQEYQNFHIYLVADNCIKPNSIPNHEKLSILFPEEALNGKVLSIKHAINQFVTKHDAILILDSDNLLHNKVLLKLNNYLNYGYIAVQAQRTAKNLDTTIAALDAMSELYYNYTQRYVAFKIGSSATIAGSGMAVKTDFFNLYINRLFEEGKQFEIAEDKLLQMMLIQQNNRIAYCREAIVFDEKVTSGSQVQRQRTRWIRSWFQHWKSAIMLLFNGIININWNMTYFGLMLSFPPQFILIFGLVGVGVIGLLINNIIFYIALSSLSVFVLQFLVAIKLSYAPKSIWKALPKIPIFIWRQVLAVLKIKTTSRTDFMATTHNQFVNIDEVWENRKDDFPYL